MDRILRGAGFTQLPRHKCAKLWANSPAPIEARGSIRLALLTPNISSANTPGVSSAYCPCSATSASTGRLTGSDSPGSAVLPPLPSQFALVALKCNSVRRYACDHLRCTFHGLVLLAGLNVLPNAVCWGSSSSDHVRRPLN